MNQEYIKILNNVKKNYKHTDLLLEIYLENFHNHYIYIRVDYYKKLKKHKLSWIDLRHYHDNFDSIVSYEYMPEDMISYLKEIISKYNNHHLYEDNLSEKYNIHINSDLLDKTKQKFQMFFNHYIDKNDRQLHNIFTVVFENLPFKLTCFLEEISAAITGDIGKFECQEEYVFDLFNDNMRMIFDEPTIRQGEETYQSGRVLFLEKIGEEYVSVVGDSSLHVVSIKYDEVTKKIKMTCSCPGNFYCKHFYATILAIRNNKFHKFYKVIPNRQNTNLLDRVMNFQFILSIGVDDQGYHFLIIENNQLRLLPVLNRQGECEFEVLEDDPEDSLTMRLKEIINNKNF